MLHRALDAVALWHLPLILAAAAAFLFAGVSQPILSVSRFWVFSQPFSILDGIQALLDQGDWLLGSVIAGFSIAVPLAKIGVLLFLWTRALRGRPAPPRLVAVLEHLGKWSMLDVFVLALLIFAIKASPLVDAHVGAAVYPFVGAIFLTSYAAHVIARRSEGR